MSDFEFPSLKETLSVLLAALLVWLAFVARRAIRALRAAALESSVVAPPTAADLAVQSPAVVEEPPVSSLKLSM